LPRTFSSAMEYFVEQFSQTIFIGTPLLFWEPLFDQGSLQDLWV
jgi:hypothetical protein